MTDSSSLSTTPTSSNPLSKPNSSQSNSDEAHKPNTRHPSISFTDPILSSHHSSPAHPLLHPLTTLLITRHSTRMFLPNAVPLQTLHTALSLAQTSPSNSNIQPWRMYLLSGPARTRLTSRLISAAQTGAAPNIPPLPSKYHHFRSELGKEVYGRGMGIAKDDTAARSAAVLRNFDFFGAPVVGVVCMDRELSRADALSVGMWLQSFLLACTAMGLGSCVEVSVAGYPEVIRSVLGERMSGSEEIICGVAVGWEDVGFRGAEVRVKRERWEENVEIVEE